MSQKKPENHNEDLDAMTPEEVTATFEAMSALSEDELDVIEPQKTARENLAALRQFHQERKAAAEAVQANAARLQNISAEQEALALRAKRQAGRWQMDGMAAALGSLEPMPDPDLAIEALTYPGGFVERFIDWAVAQSPVPSRPMALGAVIGALGTLAGRRDETDTGLRTNFYIVALASSGTGKTLTRKAITSLLDTEFPAYMAREPGSEPGLLTMLQKQPSVLWMPDEASKMFGQFNSRGAATHQSAIKETLLTLFNFAASKWAGKAYSDSGNVKGKPVLCPNLSIYATAPQDVFWKVITHENTLDGLLARCLLLNLTGADLPRVTPPGADVDRILTRLREFMPEAESLLQLSIHPLRPEELQAPECRTVYATKEAQELLDAAASWWTTASQDLDRNDPRRPALNRRWEHAVKLALLAAVADCPEDPMIDLSNARWGLRLADYSVRTLLAESKDRISESSREDLWNRIFRLVKNAGEKGITRGVLDNGLRSFDEKQISEVLRTMVGANEIAASDAGKVPGRGGPPSQRYWTPKHKARHDEVISRKIVEGLTKNPRH